MNALNSKLGAALIGMLTIGALALLLLAVVRLARAGSARDRLGRDRPPLAFRIAAPLLRVMAFHVGAIAPQSALQQRRVQLRRAALDYAVTPAELLAAKLLAATCGAALPLVTSLTSASAPPWLWMGVLAGFGWWYPDLWLAGTIRRRMSAMLKAMPFFLDVVTLSVEAGLNLTGALQQAVSQLPPSPLSAEIDRLLRDVRAGKPRIAALRERAAEIDFAPFTSLVAALVQGELTGAALAPVLRAQADQRRTERFLRAEKLALEAPVKMLGPLICCIFPCTFIIIGFPIVVRLMNSGF